MDELTLSPPVAFPIWGEEGVGGLQLLVHAAHGAGLARLQEDEDHARAAGPDHVGQQEFERPDVCGDRLLDGDRLNAAYVADLPVVLRALGLGVVAGDADSAHDDRCRIADTAVDEGAVRLGHREWKSTRLNYS